MQIKRTTFGPTAGRNRGALTGERMLNSDDPHLDLNLSDVLARVDERGELIVDHVSILMVDGSEAIYRRSMDDVELDLRSFAEQILEAANEGDEMFMRALHQDLLPVFAEDHAEKFADLAADKPKKCPPKTGRKA